MSEFFGDDILRGVDEIAEYIGERPSTTRFLLEHGRLPGFQIGRGWRMRKSLFAEWVAQREAGAMIAA